MNHACVSLDDDVVALAYSYVDCICVVWFDRHEICRNYTEVVSINPESEMCCRSSIDDAHFINFAICEIEHGSGLFSSALGVILARRTGVIALAV